jgi:DUF1365 family protein
VTGSSALYIGSVAHQRLAPKPHHFNYKVFWAFIDLDELPAMSSRLRWFSHNRFNLFSVYDRDHGDGSATPLRTQVETQLAASGDGGASGAIRLFTMPRILGYAFNPLSVYFCYRTDGSLRAICYEVHNTFRQRHSYFIRVESNAQPILQDCEKAFYVSPFMDMEMHYAFEVEAPDERVGVTIDASAKGKPVLHAQLVGRRSDFNDKTLLRLFCAIPLVTFKVILAIHWQALRLSIKGMRLRRRPVPPGHAVTIVTNSSNGAGHSKRLG